MIDRDCFAIEVAVYRVTGRLPSEVREPGQSRGVTYARHLTWWAFHRLAGAGVCELARLFGRDHSTVSEGIRRIDRELRVWQATVRDVAEVTRMVTDGE